MKKTVYVILVLLSMIMISSCEDSSTHVDNNFVSIAIVEMQGAPVILNNDPTPLSIGKLYDQYSDGELISVAEAGDATQRYLYARMLVRGMIEGVSREKGVEMLESAWREGVVDAGYDLFLAFSYTDGIRRSVDLAMEYLVSSAEKGYMLSQQTLGLAYIGRSVQIRIELDDDKAFKWFKLAADQGDLVSAGIIADFYKEGDVVPANEDIAFDWISRAESMPYGDPFAIFASLAGYYEEGIGTDVDLVQAYKYYDLLSPGSAPDKARIAEQMTPEQIHEAISLSRQWQEEHNIFVPSYYGLEYQENGTFQ